jgi:hypothetical protein
MCNFRMFVNKKCYYALYFLVIGDKEIRPDFTVIFYPTVQSI